LIDWLVDCLNQSIRYCDGTANNEFEYYDDLWWANDGKC